MKVRNILILAMALLMAAPISAKPKYRKGFLYREGRQLMLNGKPYRCVSFNSFQLCGCGHDYELFTDEQTEALFASLPDNTIVRTCATIRDFLHEVAAVIKQHDPNHLVESGTFAGWAYEGYDNYRAMHDSPYIDVGNLHEYDYDYQESNTIESPHFEPCLKAMYDLDKPLIIGETGIESGDGCRTSRERRVEAMREKFDVYIGMGASVVLVWNLAREARTCGFTFGLDDPLLKMINEYQLTIDSKTE